MKSRALNLLVICIAPLALFAVLHYLFSVSISDMSIYFGAVVIFFAGVTFGKNEEFWQLDCGKPIPHTQYTCVIFALCWIVLAAIPSNIVGVDLTNTMLVSFICIAVSGLMLPTLLKQVTYEQSTE